jgi:hypothetical protein
VYSQRSSLVAMLEEGSLGPPGMMSSESLLTRRRADAERAAALGAAMKVGEVGEFVLAVLSGGGRGDAEDGFGVSIEAASAEGVPRGAEGFEGGGHDGVGLGAFGAA